MISKTTSVTKNDAVAVNVLRRACSVCMGVLCKIKGRQMAPLGIVRGSKNGKPLRYLPPTLSRPLSCHFPFRISPRFSVRSLEADSCCEGPSFHYKHREVTQAQGAMMFPLPSHQATLCTTHELLQLEARDVLPSLSDSPATHAISLGAERPEDRVHEPEAVNRLTAKAELCG